MQPSGPRLIFKDDRDSSIGRGCELYTWHFRPEISGIMRAAGASAPRHTDLVVFTEGWRNPIRPSQRDDHFDFNAIDITARYADGSRPTKLEYEEMAWRMKLFLGPDYGFVVHGEGLNEHIHFRYRKR